MLSLEEKREAGFDFYTRLLKEEEKKFYGIFISHSNATEKDINLLTSLRNAMSEKDIYTLCDKECIKGGDDFQAKIENALDCYGAVVIITENSIRSSWVHYEVGYLKGRGKEVYVWDPEHLLSLKNRETDATIKRLYSYFKNVGTIYNEIEDVVDAVSKASPYSEMFFEENDFITKKEFYSRANERLETVIATLSSPIFDEYYTLFKECKFGVLIPNFGMFYDDHGDGERCYSKRNAPIENGICPVSSKPCALVARKTIDEDNKECVILNNVTYSGILRKAGDLDRTGVVFEESCVEFTVPLHKYYGTEFKFIIDITNSELISTLVSVLEKAGMNPSLSESKIGSRIYLSLPQRRGQGLYRLDHQFQNNFLCPYATRQKFR
ncbi:MAG: TIR domain-containing protein [Clostridia bacterium]|nr:TIR domain-containing protein [Clostridia bacterium]